MISTTRIWSDFVGSDGHELMVGRSMDRWGNHQLSDEYDVWWAKAGRQYFYIPFFFSVEFCIGWPGFCRVAY